MKAKKMSGILYLSLYALPTLGAAQSIEKQDSVLAVSVPTTISAPAPSPPVPDAAPPPLQKGSLSALGKKITLNGLFLGYYAFSFTKDVDAEGKHAPKASNNGFYMRYARINTKVEFTKRLELELLVNLADFRYNPTTTRVLEIAALKCNINSYLNIQLGQFRPYFGLEDMFSADIMKSHGWSKQYSLFGSNHWQSFQQGIALYGSLTNIKVPLRYYYNLYNGNGKNQLGDNDNAKTQSLRLEYDVIPNIKLGVNGAITEINSQLADAYGADIRVKFELSSKFTLEVDAEYKSGNNIKVFRDELLKTPDAELKMKDYRMQGIYVLPLIKWSINKKKQTSVQFSFRYEWIQELRGKPVGRIYTPMLSYVIGDTYSSRFSVAGIISDYTENIPNTAQYNSNTMLLQYQFRF